MREQNDHLTHFESGRSSPDLHEMLRSSIREEMRTQLLFAKIQMGSFALALFGILFVVIALVAPGR